MEAVVKNLKLKSLPLDPLWITLDIIVQWQAEYKTFPSYRQLARTLDAVVEKSRPTSASTTYTYVQTLLKLQYLVKKDGHLLLNERLTRQV